MPFTSSEARRMTDAIGPQVVGDKCFLAYRDMLRRWRGSPRWTTAHELYVEVLQARENFRRPQLGVPPDIDQLAAIELAWQVLFNDVIMAYETLKRVENGQPDF